MAGHYIAGRITNQYHINSCSIKYPANEKSYAVIMEIFSPAAFIFCSVLVVIFFTSVDDMLGHDNVFEMDIIIALAELVSPTRVWISPSAKPILGTYISSGICPAHYIYIYH